MNDDPRYLAVPEHIANDQTALELANAWFSSNKISVVTRTGTGLDERPEIWGQVLAALGHNAAMSSASLGQADFADILAKMKAALDSHWQTPRDTTGQYYPPKSG